MRKKIVITYRDDFFHPVKREIVEFGPPEYAEYFTDHAHKGEKLDYRSVKAFIEDSWESISDSLSDDDAFADWLRDNYYPEGE